MEFWFHRMRSEFLILAREGMEAREQQKVHIWQQIIMFFTHFKISFHVPLAEKDVCDDIII